jgi:hypothetical protein
MNKRLQVKLRFGTHQNEDMPMEGLALALKNDLHVHLGSTVSDMPKDAVGTNRNMVQEWDAAFKVR